MNRSLTLKDKKQLVLNSDIKLAEQDGNGKGRYFVSRFIEPGIAHYEELGDILITKETLNKFIHSMVGVPVIIDHEDVTDKNVDKLRVGSVSKVWFDEFDGYFYCEGILTDPEAIDLVKNQGWNVSCAYSFVADETKKQHNGKDIDMEFTDGEFLHLAIVKNPRYEGANIVVNKNDDELEWITVKGNHIPIKKGQSKDEAVKEFLEGKKEGNKNKFNQDYEPNNAEKMYAKKTGFKVNEIILAGGEKAKIIGIKRDDVSGDTFQFDVILEKNPNITKTYDINVLKKYNKTKNDIGDITMQVLNELKEFIKNVVSNEKEDEMAVKNEDKRKLIDEIGGILKDKVDDEIIRTVIKKAEELSYEPSEDDKADNKAKNEEEKDKEEAKNKCKNEEDKKDEKAKNEDEEEENKDITENEEEEKEEKKEVKNSIKDVVMGGNTQVQQEKLYISRKDRLEEGNKY